MVFHFAFTTKKYLWSQDKNGIEFELNWIVLNWKVNLEYGLHFICKSFIKIPQKQNIFISSTNQKTMRKTLQADLNSYRIIMILSREKYFQCKCKKEKWMPKTLNFIWENSIHQFRIRRKKNEGKIKFWKILVFKQKNTQNLILVLFFFLAGTLKNSIILLNCTTRFLSIIFPSLPSPLSFFFFLISSNFPSLSEHSSFI